MNSSSVTGPLLPQFKGDYVLMKIPQGFSLFLLFNFVVLLLVARIYLLQPQHA